VSPVSRRARPGANRRARRFSFDLPRRGRTLFLTLLGINALPVIASTAAAPSLPSMSRAFADVPGIDGLIPLVLTLGPLGVALSGPFVGLAIDRLGRRPVLIAGSFAYAVVGVIPALTTDLRAILVARFLLGVTVCCLMAGAVTVISDQFEGTTRARVLSVQAGIVGVIAMVVIFGSGLLAQTNWRLSFLVHLVALPIVPLIVRLIPERPPVSAANPTGSVGAAVPASVVTGAAPASSQAPLRLPQLSLRTLVPVLFGAMLLLQTANFLAILQVPYVLEVRFGSGPAIAGVAVAVATLAYAVGALFSVSLAQRFVPLAAAACALSVIGAAYLGIARGGLPLVLLANFLGGLGFGLIVPNLLAWLAAVAPPLSRGRLFGGLTGSLFLGQFLSPIIWRPLVDRVGGAEAIWVCGILCLVLSALLAVLSVRRTMTVPALRLRSDAGRPFGRWLASRPTNTASAPAAGEKTYDPTEWRHP